MNGYYVRKPGGATSGPHDVATIKAMASDGRLSPSDGLSRDGKQWRSASKANGLTFRPAPAATPTTPEHAERDILLGWFADRWKSFKDAWNRSVERAELLNIEKRKRKAEQHAKRSAEREATKQRQAAEMEERSRREAERRSNSGTWVWITINECKLSHKVVTPFGSKVTMVRLWLRAEYELIDGQVHVKSVRLAQPRETPDGRWNAVATRTGEAFVLPHAVKDSSIQSLFRMEFNDDLKRSMIRNIRDREG